MLTQGVLPIWNTATGTVTYSWPLDTASFLSQCPEKVAVTQPLAAEQRTHQEHPSLASIKPMCRFFKYLAQISFPSSKSLCSEYPATRFYCSLLTFQFLLLSFTACFMFCVVLQHWGWKDYCSRLRPFQWLCCASSYQILLWTQDLMKFSLSLCCLVFQLFFLNFQRVQKLK